MRAPKSPLDRRASLRHRWVLRAVATLLLGLARVDSAAAAEDHFDARRKLDEAYAQQLRELASWCDENRLSTEAATTRARLRERDPRKLYLKFLRPSGDDAADATASTASSVSDEWRTRFDQLRRDQAQARFELAQSAIRQGHASLAFDLVLDALDDDPDHAACRRLMGYQKFRGEWRTTYEMKKLRSGQVWSDRFGWLPKNYLKRYEAGERLVGNRWMPAEEEARARSHIADGWQIETEHYHITTNHSHEAGVALGLELERLHFVWRQIFAAYTTSAGQLTSLFEGRSSQRSNLPPHRVVYFRDRDDYLATLKDILPPNIDTAGIYSGDRRTAFFYARENDDHSTLYHEATHQLFSESRVTSSKTGREANFWLVEGIACYMESLGHEDGYETVGGAGAVRFRDARYRLLESDFYVPLAQLSAMGVQAFQQDANVPMLYSQSAGLAHFLMHYDGGRYRDALVGLLVELYSEKDRSTTLTELTGKKFAELDGEYREFISSAKSR